MKSVYMCRSLTFLKRMVFKMVQSLFLGPFFFWFSSSMTLQRSPAPARLNEGAQVISLSSHIPGAILDPRLARWPISSRKISGIRDSHAPVIPITISGWWYTYPSEKYESQLGLLFPIYGKKTNHQPDLVDLQSPLDFYGFLRTIQGPDGFSILPDSANIWGFSRTRPPRSP